MKVGNKKVMKQMEERGILNKGDTLGYAFGQGIHQYRGVNAVSHGGADAGFRSYLVRFPDQNISIAVLSNLGSFDPGGLANKIADIYLKDHLKGETKKSESEPLVAGGVKVNDKLLKLYEGKYQLDPNFIVSFKLEDGKFIVQATGQPPFPLVASNDSTFHIAPANVKIVFNKKGDNTVEQFTLHQGGGTMIAKRMAPFDARSLDLKSFTGTYYSPELQTSYTLELKGDTLVANHIRHDPAPMTPVGTDSFSTNAWFMSTIDFIRNAKNEITGLKVSSGRVKNVRFEKREM
jgi:hypothetical protein